MAQTIYLTLQGKEMFHVNTLLDIIVCVIHRH